ncbi:MAG: sulfite exporter TauE/SafE family protein, partial [Methanomicrobiales archaeon]
CCSGHFSSHAESTCSTLFPFGSLPGSCRISSFSSGVTASLAERGYPGAFLLGVIFAMSFCPFSVVLFFAMLIPLALGAGDPVLIPAVFAIATGLPVIVISYLLVTGVGKCSGIVKKVGEIEPWIRRAVAAVFIVVGLYYIAIVYGSGV